MSDPAQKIAHIAKRVKLTDVDKKEIESIKQFFTRQLSSKDGLKKAPMDVQLAASSFALFCDKRSTDKGKMNEAMEVEKMVLLNMVALTEIQPAANSRNSPAQEQWLNDAMKYMLVLYTAAKALTNGLISQQKYWKARVTDLNALFNEEVSIKGAWARMKLQIPWLEVGVGAITGVGLSLTNVLDPAIKFTQAFVQELSVYATRIVNEITLMSFDVQNTREFVVKNVYPLIALGVEVGTIVFLAWIGNKMDKKAFDRKMALIDKYNSSHKELIAEERQSRRMLFDLYKEKALQLCVKYGFTEELKIEDPEYYVLLKKKEYKELKALHSKRVKAKISGDVSPESSEIDSHSTDLPGTVENGGKKSRKGAASKEETNAETHTDETGAEEDIVSEARTTGERESEATADAATAVKPVAPAST